MAPVAPMREMCVQRHKVQFLDKIVAPLLSFIQQAQCASDELLNEKLLHKGGVCHESSHNTPGSLQNHSFSK